MYSQDFKIATTQLYEKIGSSRKVASLIGCSFSTVCRWIRDRYAVKQPRKSRQSVLHQDGVLLAVELYVRSHPFCTTTDVKTVLEASLGKSVSTELARLAIHKLGLSRKRPRFYPEPYCLQDKTKTFIDEREKVKHLRFVSLDETGFSSNVRPSFGYCKKGCRLHVKYRPTAEDKKHISVLAAIQEDGSLLYTKHHGHFTHELFLKFLKDCPYPSNTVILLDNVRFHHCISIKEYAKTRGWILLYTPPYSPWFNPIEKLFSVVKVHYRKHRSIDAAFQAVGSEMVRNIMKSRCVE